MNDMPSALPFEEIASFRAVVLLPHGPNALRLSDMYAASIPMVVPGEPLVHKFVWATRTFGGFDADHHYRDRAPDAMRKAAVRDPTSLEGHPPYSPFNFLRAWSIHRLIDDRRYWYQYTEWATLPHLRRFVSLPDLVSALVELSADKALLTSVQMARHHAGMVADALGWWRAAVSDLIVGSE